LASSKISFPKLNEFSFSTFAKRSMGPGFGGHQNLPAFGSGEAVFYTKSISATARFRSIAKRKALSQLKRICPKIDGWYGHRIS